MKIAAKVCEAKCTGFDLMQNEPIRFKMIRIEMMYDQLGSAN